MRVRSLLLTGLAALVMGCSGDAEDGTLYNPPQKDPIHATGSSDSDSLPNFTLEDPKIVEPIPEPEEAEEPILAQEHSPECLDGTILEQACETGNPCLGTQTLECDDGKWQKWGQCEWLHETPTPVAVSKPVYSNGVVAAINFAGNINNNDVYAGTLEGGLQLVSSVKAASWLVSAGDHLGNVFPNGEFSFGECQIIRISDEAVLYDGTCPDDFDGTMLVRKDGSSSLSVFDYLNSEEVALLDVGATVKSANISVEYVAYHSKESNGKSRVSLWNFIDETLISFDPPEGFEDKEPLISGNHLVFGRYNKGTHTMKLMRYDIGEDSLAEIFEGNYLSPFFEHCDAHQLQENNGMTLSADLDNPVMAFRNQTWYDFTPMGTGCSAKWGFGINVMDIEMCTGGEVAFYQKGLSLPTPSKPSIDDGTLVWGYGGKVLWCNLDQN